jgi:hypothetical protein
MKWTPFVNRSGLENLKKKAHSKHSAHYALHSSVFSIFIVYGNKFPTLKNEKARFIL